MITMIFISWIIGAIVLYLAQKIQSKSIRIIVRIIGLGLVLWPFLWWLYGLIS